MSRIDAENDVFRLATELVNYTSKNIFLTGKAGTGKTTFLKHIRETCPKQMAVLAPTGVAAINAGGVTIHSFFQLPFTPFLPDARSLSVQNEVSDKHTLLGRIRFTSERRKVIQQLELLIIDEISMVRCDVLDAIDVVLKHVRQNYHQPFGGVQILFIGDLYQLPPVAKEQEWSLLSQQYESPYFFSSKALGDAPPLFIEFRKIYRQSEQQFIDLLNQVRNNSIDESGTQLLHSRYQPDAAMMEKDGYIILTTHNEKARRINEAALDKLPAKMFSYMAEVEGEFSEGSFPADAELKLKAGAQVMFLKNDTEGRRYFNGRIGVVKSLEPEKITVTCKKPDGSEEDIEVSHEKWENIRYTLNKTSKQVEETLLGSFRQYPLRLAWAITIHKSQGLTFEKALIDAGASFSPGQVYVALSRCTSLDGLILSSRLYAHNLHTDPRIGAFSSRTTPEDHLEEELINAKRDYQLIIMRGLFDCRSILINCKHLFDEMLKHTSSFNEGAYLWAEQLQKNIAIMQTTAEKFFPQLQQLFYSREAPEQNQQLITRLKAASEYFSREITFMLQHLQSCPAVTDNRQLAQEFNSQAKEIFTDLSYKVYMLQGFSGKFDIEKFFQRKKRFTAPATPVNAYSGSGAARSSHKHPELYQLLKLERDSICSQKNIPAYMVLSSRSLEDICSGLPQTMEELATIRGFGKKKLDNYGPRFLKLVQTYASDKQLTSQMHLVPVSRRSRRIPENKVSDTYTTSYILFRQGISISEIAKQRNLAASTIEGHLCHFLRNGSIKIEELISDEKVNLVKKAMKNFDGNSIAPVKAALGNLVSYGEIRMIMAASAVANDDLAA